MNTQPHTEAKGKFLYNPIPTQVCRKEFNRYLASHLKKPTKGPKPKLSLYKIFNYILYVLHTGIQWDQLKTKKNELHWTNVYKWHNRWSKDGSYQALFEASIIHLKDTKQLDVSLIHGDGSNMVVKKGARALATRVTNTKKAKKNSLSLTIRASSWHPSLLSPLTSMTP
jgi:transposase